LVIEILGLPLAVQVDRAKKHDVRADRAFLSARLGELPGIKAIVAHCG